MGNLTFKTTFTVKTDPTRVRYHSWTFAPGISEKWSATRL